METDVAQPEVDDAGEGIEEERPDDGGRDRRGQDGREEERTVDVAPAELAIEREREQQPRADADDGRRDRVDRRDPNGVPESGSPRSEA